MARSRVPHWVSDREHSRVELAFEDAEDTLDDLSDALRSELKAVGADPGHLEFNEGEFIDHPSTRGIMVADANGELEFDYEGETYTTTLNVNHAIDAIDGTHEDNPSWLYAFIDSKTDTLAELEFNGLKRWKAFASDLVKEFLMNHRQGRRASAVRVVRRFLANDRITVDDLEEIGGNMLEGDEDLEGLAKKLQRANVRNADDLLEEADKVLKTFGVEAIWEEGEYSQPAAIYLNTGDSYALTLVFDYVEGELMLTGWGDYVEHFEREYGDEGRAIRASERKAEVRLDPLVQRWADNQDYGALAEMMAQATMVDPKDRRFSKALDLMAEGISGAYTSALEADPVDFEWEPDGGEETEVEWSEYGESYSGTWNHPSDLYGSAMVRVNVPNAPVLLVDAAKRVGVDLDPSVVKSLVSRGALDDFLDEEVAPALIEALDDGSAVWWEPDWLQDIAADASRFSVDYDYSEPDVDYPPGIWVGDEISVYADESKVRVSGTTIEFPVNASVPVGAG
jgi:hypothetical protein